MFRELLDTLFANTTDKPEGSGQSAGEVDVETGEKAINFLQDKLIPVFDQWSKVFSVNFFLVLFCVYALMYGIKKSTVNWPKTSKLLITLSEIGRRLLPLLPIFFGGFIMFIFQLSDWYGGAAFIHGCVAGFASPYARKLLNRTILGKE